MRIGSVFAFLAVVSMATAVNAQTKISGKSTCAPPEVQHMIPVGDQEGHTFGISKQDCTWDTPLEINGIKSKAGVNTGFDEVEDGKSKAHGFYLDTMENGDQAHYRWKGTMVLKGEKPESGDIEWELTRGTGKMKGVKASGTCKGKGTAEGGISWECTGSYTST